MAGVDDPPQGQGEKAGVEATGPEVLGEGPLFRIPGEVEDRGLDPLRIRTPPGDVAGQTEPLGAAGAAVDRDLAHRRDKGTGTGQEEPSGNG